MRKKKRKGPTVTVKAICRDCKTENEVARVDFNRASQPRCIACGGMLDTNSIVHRGIEGGVARTSAFSRSPGARSPRQSNKRVSDIHRRTYKPK